MKSYNLMNCRPFRTAQNFQLAAGKLMAVATLMVLLSGTAVMANAQFSGPSFLPSPVQIYSTVPANGDVNPYGVAFVPTANASPLLNPGDLLVSNFNSALNLQGTGTTIVRIPAGGGTPSLFFQSDQAHRGLTTALAVLREGFVMVGSLPTADGTCATVSPGSLLVVSAVGQLAQVLTDGNISGPWDMTVYNPGNGKIAAFVSNAITGNVVRLDLALQGGQVRIVNSTVIGSYQHRCDPVALFAAPTGLVYDANKDVLYVSSTADNAVFAISQARERNSDAGSGTMIYTDQQHLHGALAMTIAPNGHLLVSNSDVINQDQNQPSEIVEFTTNGQFVKQLSVDPNLGGSFGLNVSQGQFNTKFAAVDDDQNTISIWTLPTN